MNCEFLSDNSQNIPPAIWNALEDANKEAANVPYGQEGDVWTENARLEFKRCFGEEAEVFFLNNGTAANVLSLKTILKPHHTIYCSKSSHLKFEECGAIHNHVGCSLTTIPTDENGKILIHELKDKKHGVSAIHYSKPGAISISQSTEVGGVYTPDEIRKISEYAHNNDIYLHMDGARLCYAAAALGVSLKEISTDCGVDVLSFGGTKMGLMGGDAVIFLKEGLGKEFEWTQKQGGQLNAKMWYIAAQFYALLTDDKWREMATHANRMAKRIEEVITNSPFSEVACPASTNQVFFTYPHEFRRGLAEKFRLYDWEISEYGDSTLRVVTSPTTTNKAVESLIAAIDHDTDIIELYGCGHA